MISRFGLQLKGIFNRPSVILTKKLGYRSIQGASSSFENDKRIFPDFPSGPLSEYRKRASFDWKKLKQIIFTKDELLLMNEIYEYYENDPLFVRVPGIISTDEERRLIVARANALKAQNFSKKMDLSIPINSFGYALASMSFEAALGYKQIIAIMFSNSIRDLGTERLQKFRTALDNDEITGSFLLTEIGHGTNVKGMRTTAHYDANTEEFIINTPDFEAAKCWSGNLGKTCTHGIVYAQMFTPDGENHGLNGFVVPIRDPKTFLSLPGITVGDLGEKIGLNGVDNGFAIFNNYRIPRENLLAKAGDVTPEGKFVTSFKNPRDRFGLMLGAISQGRITITSLNSAILLKAVTIALRYSAARKQFGPNDKEEYPVLEYQSQQHRLLPHLASGYVFRLFGAWLFVEYENYLKKVKSGEDVGIMGMEFHSISAACKPVTTWTTRDAIQDCRECCGGHGYLKATGLGDVRNENDPNCTYEGENTVILQQASMWLLGVRKREFFGVASPLGSVSFLENCEEVLKTKYNWTTAQEAMKPENILLSLNWLCAWLLEHTAKRVEMLKTQGKSSFDARNDSQVFFANNLSLIYGQRFIFSKALEIISDLPSSNEKTALLRLISLHGATVLMKYSGFFYQGGYFNGSESLELIQEGILELLPIIKDDSMGLIDAISPSDLMINSVLGNSDGEIYKHLQRTIMGGKATFERPSWWQDIIIKNKL